MSSLSITERTTIQLEHRNRVATNEILAVISTKSQTSSSSGGRTTRTTTNEDKDYRQKRACFPLFWLLAASCLLMFSSLPQRYPTSTVSSCNNFIAVNCVHFIYMNQLYWRNETHSSLIKFVSATRLFLITGTALHTTTLNLPSHNSPSLSLPQEQHKNLFTKGGRRCKRIPFSSFYAIPRQHWRAPRVEWPRDKEEGGTRDARTRLWRRKYRELNGRTRVEDLCFFLHGHCPSSFVCWLVSSNSSWRLDYTRHLIAINNCV